jgi:UDP-2-acetamido-2,6-beta-L-arabino-hexul-4-ose reductase
MNWDKDYDVIDLIPHVDERGGLFEVIRFKDFAIPGGGQVYTFTINPNKRRGDHYHLKKKEWFTCVYGKAKILLTTSKGEDVIMEISADDPKLIYAGAGTTHALMNEEETVAVIVSYGTVQHDDSDPDTYRKRACESLG